MDFNGPIDFCIMSEEMNFPVILRKARNAVSNKNYDEAAVLYTSVMAHEDMADNFDIKVRHAFCVEKTGHINQAIKLYHGIATLYRDADEEGAAKGIEQTINDLEAKLKAKAEAAKAAAAEKARAEQEKLEQERAAKAAAAKAAAEKAAAEKAEIERLALEKAREEHAQAEAERFQEIWRKKEAAEKARAARAKTGKASESSTSAGEGLFDLADSEGSENGTHTFDGSDTIQIELL